MNKYDSSFYEEDYLDDEESVGFKKIKSHKPKRNYSKMAKEKDSLRKKKQARQKEKELYKEQSSEFEL